MSTTYTIVIDRQTPRFVDVLIEGNGLHALVRGIKLKEAMSKAADAIDNHENQGKQPHSVK